MQFNITKSIEENKNVIDTKFIYNRTFKRFEEKNGENWIINETQLKKIILEPTGFAISNSETDIYSSNISFSTDGTRILNITPVNEHFIFYVNGKEYVKTDVSQVQIADIEGLHYIYFNNNGMLESKTDFTLADIMRKYASVATVYWDYTNKKAIYIGDKRHAMNSDAYQNYLNFINDKTSDYIEGTFLKFTSDTNGAINNKVDGDGSSNYHTSFAIDSGKYRNYDLLNDSEHIEFNEDIPIFYKQTISQEKNWVAMAKNDDSSVIVAIADDGEYRVMVSQDDGATWEKIYLQYYSNWIDITYADGKFVAVASSGEYSIMTSEDGFNWSFVPVAQKNKWQSVTYGNNLFVAVASNGTNTIMTSPNGSIWTMRTTPTYLPLKSVTYMPTNNSVSGKFIAISEDDIFNLIATSITVSKAFSSTNGETWTNLNISQEKSWALVNFANSVFVGLANTGKHRLFNALSNGYFFITSELINSTIDLNSTWTSIMYAFGYHMAVSSTGDSRFIRSADGITWESFSNLSTSNAWRRIRNNSTLTVAIATTGTNKIAYSSNNGTTWITTTSQDTKTLEDMVYGADKWVAVSSSASAGGRIAYSTDLITWTNITTYDSQQWVSIAYANNTYVAVGQNGTNRILYSSNGIAWSVSNISVTKVWTIVKYLQNGFFALNTDNEIYYSVNGQGNWYKIVFTVNTTGVTFTNFATSSQMFVFTTTTNRVITTGINITINGSNGTFNDNKFINIVDNLSLTSIAHDGNGSFVVGTKQNKLLTSNDNGTTWTIKDIVDAKINKVKYMNNNFFLINSSGVNRIAYSSNLFSTVKYITTTVFNYSISDLIYQNGNYIILLNVNNYRVIRISNLIYTLQESELINLFNYVQAVRDTYNSWRKVYDSNRTEAIKNRCVIQNNKINYNKFANGFYTLESCGNNKFYLYHIFMTNDKDNKYIIICGNHEYDTKEEAKNAIMDEINKLSGLPFNDFLSLGTIIYEANSNYTNTAKARIVNINGNNYYKLIKKDLISSSSNNNSLTQINKKENTNLLNNTDLINLYGNKILEYALNKLQSIVNRDIDSFVTRQEITLLPSALTNINTIFGSQITGSYEIFDKNNPEISMILFLKQNGISSDPDVNITSYTSLILPNKIRAITDSTSLFGVYIENYLVNFINFSNNTINLVIYRKI